MPDTPEQPRPAVTRLTVLPSSGKVDQLKRELLAEGRPAPAAPPSPATTVDANADPRKQRIEGKVIAALKQVYDPEIPVNLYDLGLIYKVEVSDDDRVRVQMTLTAPGCPVAGTLPGEVERKVEAIDEVRSAEVVLVWDPPWDKSRMSEEALLELGML